MGAEEQGGWRQPHRDYGHLGVTGARGGLELWVRQVLLVRGPHWTRPPPWAHVHTLVLACRRLREALASTCSWGRRCHSVWGWRASDFGAPPHWERHPASLKGLGWHLVIHRRQGPGLQKSGLSLPHGKRGDGSEGEEDQRAAGCMASESPSSGALWIRRCLGTKNGRPAGGGCLAGDLRRRQSRGRRGTGPTGPTLAET